MMFFLSDGIFDCDFSHLLIISKIIYENPPQRTEKGLFFDVFCGMIYKVKLALVYS